MSQDNRAVEDEVADASTLPIMNIAAADSRLLNVDAHVVLIAETGNRTVLERHIPDGLENECSVLHKVC